MVQDGAPIAGFKPSIARPSFGTVLQKFRGKLATITPVGKVGNDGKPYTQIVFDFVDVMAIRSVEPYPYPIAQISITYKDPSNSQSGTKWAAFSASARGFLGDEGDLNELLGKEQEWELAPAMLRQALVDEENNPIMVNGRAKWGEVEGEAWQVVAVSGVAAPAAGVGGQSVASPASPSGALSDIELLNHLAKLADGKSEQQFNITAMNDPKVRANQSLVQSIIKRETLGQLEALGLVKRTPEGIWKSNVPE